MPANHKKDHVPLFEGKDVVPKSLREAIYSFVLACAVRTIRGDGEQHSSMLIHVTRYNLVQREVERQVAEVVKRAKQRITRKIDFEPLLAEIKTLWQNDFVPTMEELINRNVVDQKHMIPEWDEIVLMLPDVLADIEVRMINGKAKEALVYAVGQGKGLKVIAIGGDKLSRGLTLEGLCTSYFVRTTKMYDTLMQMGRWFGYRPGYLDICRLYTSADLIEWFGHIADASEELRDEFDNMAANGATPNDYGLKVLSHPVLLVTSPLKMRTSKALCLSFSNSLLETVSMHKDVQTLSNNLLATNRLISSMGQPNQIDPVQTRRGSIQRWRGFLWNHVPSDAIASFFEEFVTHPSARKVNSFLLSKFVRSMCVEGELTAWTVVLLGGGDGGDHNFHGELLLKGMPKRSATVKIEDRYSIGRLLSPRDEAIDLDEDSWCAALDLTIKLWKPDATRTETDTKPTDPNGPAIRQIRGLTPERGLLLLYPLDPKLADPDGRLFENDVNPIMAFGVSFPSSRSGVKVEYKVDHLRWEEEYGSAE